MPNQMKIYGPQIDTGNPDTMNQTTLGRPGELGAEFDWNDRVYQIVKIDSGCIASILTPAANQLLYWKDRSAYLVTNDYRFGGYPPVDAGIAVGNTFANNVAGVLRVAATPGNYICALKKGRNIALAEEGSAKFGMRLYASVTTPVADAIGYAVGGTARPDYQDLGVVRTDTATTTCYADVDICDVP